MADAIDSTLAKYVDACLVGKPPAFPEAWAARVAANHAKSPASSHRLSSLDEQLIEASQGFATAEIFALSVESGPERSQERRSGDPAGSSRSDAAASQGVVGGNTAEDLVEITLGCGSCPNTPADC